VALAGGTHKRVFLARPLANYFVKQARRERHLSHNIAKQGNIIERKSNQNDQTIDLKKDHQKVTST
jgi:hypothetical protein